MFPTNTPIPINSNTPVVHDVESVKHTDPNNSNVKNGNEGSNGAPYANSLIASSKKMQDELEKSGSKMRRHEDNLKFLKAHKNQLDDTILDLQVSLGKSLSSDLPNTEDDDSSRGRSEEETVEQILKHEKSAAVIFCVLKSCHGIQLANPTLSQELLGVVAMLGKVNDGNLSRLFSEYLGLPTMLAIVCKTCDGIKSLETYDYEGAVNKFSGIYALGASVGQTLEGRFLVMCLENLRPYPGEIVADDPQRILDIPKPRLPNGDIPAGFLGFAVNMVHVDRAHLVCLTSSGCGLRETLFYNLFSRLQVYKTRAEMLLALPCIIEGAVSLDGGMIRADGVFSLGTREDVNVRFPISSLRHRLSENHHELENQLKQRKWEKERLQEDIRREQSLLDQEKYNFQLRKQDFLKFLKDSSSVITKHQLQTLGRDKQSPR
ncbi:protein DEFECTIVE IN MERISTEM SILENCING 3-like isoform X1 [Silene latifolia]|uniref:protein DEFECTIVE IN MERISTEM SILENCING 3-like isoform X1 n=2 Tax=Silene latifolia TaxID=37657 RepID=UPI003D788099